MKKLLFISLLGCFLGISTIAKAQLFDMLSNPQITVNIQHAPGLGLKIKKVVFNKAFGKCSDQITAALIQDFVNNQVDVIDRSNLNTILAGHNFNANGGINRSNAVSIGKIIGPSALISVKVLRCETKKDRLSGTEKKYNSKTKTTDLVKFNIAKTTVYLKVSIQTVDLTTGRIFTANVFDYAPFQENKSYAGEPESPSEFVNQERAINFLASDVHRMFFTWSEPSLLYYFDDKDGGLKQAFQALKAGDVDGAFNLSIQNLATCKQTPATKPKILAHAYYNVGMSYMINSEYDKALENFRQSQLLRPGDILTTTIRNCIKARDLLTEMQRVDANAAIEEQNIQADTEVAVKSQQVGTLKNADIISLTKQKLSKALIIQKIKTSNCMFDTSTKALVALTKAGVNEAVISLMMEKQ